MTASEAVQPVRTVSGGMCKYPHGERPPSNMFKLYFKRSPKGPHPSSTSRWLNLLHFLQEVVCLFLSCVCTEGHSSKGSWDKEKLSVLVCLDGDLVRNWNDYYLLLLLTLDANRVFWQAKKINRSFLLSWRIIIKIKRAAPFKQIKFQLLNNILPRT